MPVTVNHKAFNIPPNDEDNSRAAASLGAGRAVLSAVGDSRDSSRASLTMAVLLKPFLADLAEGVKLLERTE